MSDSLSELGLNARSWILHAVLAEHSIDLASGCFILQVGPAARGRRIFDTVDCSLRDAVRHLGPIEREALVAITTGDRRRDCARQGNEARNNSIQISSVRDLLSVMQQCNI
jgi:uncharacterized lipoprotein YajG